MGEYDDRSITYIMKSKSYLFRILSTPAWSLEVGRPLHVVLLPLLGLQHGLEVEKNRNGFKIWLILFQCVNMTIDRSITYIMKSNFTFMYDDRSIIYNMKSKSYLFRISPTPAWCLEIGWSHHVDQPLDCLQHGLEVQKNRNRVKIWLFHFNGWIWRS